MGEQYGTLDYEGPSDQLVSKFREELRTLLGAGPEPENVSSPVQGVLMQRWLAITQDPERSIADWCKDGVLLGINVEIPTNGIFPNVGIT